MLTSSCSGVMFLNSEDRLLAISPSFSPLVPLARAFTVSVRKTCQALAGASFGALKSAFSFKSFTLSFSCLAAFRACCLSVRGFFGFGFGFDAVFFFGLGFDLSLGLAEDFSLAIALGAVLLGPGVFAALVAEVVGALLCVVDTLPVWALGLDTGLSAYDRNRNGERYLNERVVLTLLL